MPIVRGIDLAIQPGELVAILGPNGAGKSTFVKAMVGVVPTFAGTTLLAGQDITSMQLHQRITAGLAFVLKQKTYSQA